MCKSMTINVLIFGRYSTLDSRKDLLYHTSNLHYVQSCETNWCRTTTIDTAAFFFFPNFSSIVDVSRKNPRTMTCENIGRRSMFSDFHKKLNIFDKIVLQFLSPTELFRISLWKNRRGGKKYNAAVET